MHDYLLLRKKANRCPLLFFSAEAEIKKSIGDFKQSIANRMLSGVNR
jgi:hypothetical protein